MKRRIIGQAGSMVVRSFIPFHIQHKLKITIVLRAMKQLTYKASGTCYHPL